MSAVQTTTAHTANNMYSLVDTPTPDGHGNGCAEKAPAIPIHNAETKSYSKDAHTAPYIPPLAATKGATESILPSNTGPSMLEVAYKPAPATGPHGSAAAAAASETAQVVSKSPPSFAVLRPAAVKRNWSKDEFDAYFTAYKPKSIQGSAENKFLWGAVRFFKLKADIPEELLLSVKEVRNIPQNKFLIITFFSFCFP